ncbi:hypothetical protein [Enterocloster alcoholdehydrogenati]|uniref:Transglutaminase-like domain-containing protein n=1 Tax=Enterocloster alcoholdehydrogenati TaxID=2547410 RepID=A0ABQ0AZX8_9FIRM
MKKLVKVLAVTAAMMALTSMTVFADQGQPAEQVQTESTTESSDEYPLKGRVEKYLGVTDEGYLTWYWNGPHVINEGIVPAGMTGWSYIDQRSIEDKDPNYHIGLSGRGIAVLGILSGNPYKNNASDTPETAQLLGEVREFMNSFDWRSASDLEKATRICERIHQADYDYDAANEAYETGWSDSPSYGAYGCLVNGKAVCQGYTEAANLLALCVGLTSAEMGDVGHTYPLFLVDGVWLANEPTTKDKYFTVANVYKYNPGYQMMLNIGGDLSDFTEVTKYQGIGQYCYQVGYTIPTDKNQLSKFGSLGEVFGETTIDFNDEYR